jgi:hypothetical protein
MDFHPYRLPIRLYSGGCSVVLRSSKNAEKIWPEEMLTRLRSQRDASPVRDELQRGRHVCLLGYSANEGFPYRFHNLNFRPI